MAAAAVLCLVALAFGGCGGESGRGSKAPPPVPFRVVDDRVVIAVTVAGRTVPMVLDSAGPTVVSERLVRLAGAGSIGLRIGGVELRDVRAPVVSIAGSPLECASPYGVIGADLLAGKAVRIDFAASRIWIAANGARLPSEGDADVLPFTPAGGSLPVPRVAASLGAAKRRLAIDTAGPRYLTLHGSPGAAARGLTFSAAATGARGADGRLAFTRLPALRLHRLVRRDVVAATALDSSRPEALGVPFLRDFDVTIDWRSRTVALARAHSGRPADGGFKTYGFLPARRRGNVVAGAVMTDGPAAAAGLRASDRLTSAGGIALEHASAGDFCGAYAEALNPTRDIERIEFVREGHTVSADVAAIAVRPRDLEAPARPPEPRAPRPARAGPRSVFVDGDSLSVGARPYLERNLRGWRIAHSALKGRSTTEGLAVLRARARSLPPVIVMALGTNDDPRATQAFDDAIRATLAITGPRRCVVWPTIVRPPFAGVSYAGLNRVLADEADRYENLLIVDWVRTIRAHPEWLTPDGVHLTPDGYAARARAIAAAVRLCR